MSVSATVSNVLLLSLLISANANAADKKKAEPATAAARGDGSVMSFHDLKADSLEGKATPLSTYKGKVALVVNTASECGKTPQYADLQKLWTDYEKKGLVILGFPSNDFGKQEPGSADEIRKFCNLKYRVTFPMFAKVKTKGEGQSPVYQFLSAKHGEPQWNFHKYLVGKDGQVVRAFEAGVKPDDKDLMAAIDAALK